MSTDNNNNNNGAEAAGGAAASAAVNNNNNNPQTTDVLLERVIQSEYMIWKKNTPYLYDFVLTHSLEWPSLTCQWLPPKAKQHNNASSTTTAGTNKQELLIGTHTTGGDQNYLMVATCVLPAEDVVVDQSNNATATTANAKNGGGDAQPVVTPACSSSSSPGSSNNNNNKNASGGAGAAAGGKAGVTSVPRYDEEKKEVGGFGQAAGSNIGKIDIKMKVKHEGEVNRARYMPQDPFIVATRGPSAECYIFNLSKHTSNPAPGSTFAPEGVCMGHEKEGYGMVWSPHKEGLLLTGSEDTTVKLWDVSSAIAPKAQSGTQIKPVATFLGHSDTVEDVDWHRQDANLVGSVGDDRVINIWDIRDPSKAKHTVSGASSHKGDINCIAFNPVNEYVFATGSADQTVAIWDLRNLKQRVQSLIGHQDQVYMVEWAPFNESILGSCAADRRVAIWDLSRIGQEQSPEDEEDGPPELLFLHGGHTSKVSDFSWNPVDDWTVASVSEDNVLQIWNMAEEIYATEGDAEDEDDGEGDDGGLGDDDLE